MSALHIPSGGNAQTAANSFAGIGTTNWSLRLQYRVNVTPVASLLGGLPMFHGLDILSGLTSIEINPSQPALYISLKCGAGFLFWQQNYAVGQIFDILFAYDAVFTSYIYIDGVPVASQAGMGTSTAAGTHTIGFAPYGDGDISVGGLSMWSSRTVPQADATAMASGTSPLSLSNPPDGYIAFAGTSGTPATSGDPGLANLGAGGSGYDVVTVSGANYSSDSLLVNQLLLCGEAFVTGTGAFALFRIASTFTAFSIVDDNAVYDAALMSVTMVDGGSDYSNSPVAHISGGNPSRAATFGTPIVVDGKIVGVPVFDRGDGYPSSGAGVTISFTNSTGSGAVGVPVIAGQPLPVTAVGSAPTILVDGVPATLNPQAFWSSSFNAFTFVVYQIQTPVQPGQVVTYTLPSGWASSNIGTAGPSAANAVANNYATTIEPMFIPPSYSMKMGMNHVADPMVNFAFCSIGQDISKRFSIGTAPMTQWADKTAGIGSWVIGGNYNELPVPAGPTVVFVGDGTSAVAACMIAGGVIQSVPMVSSSSDWTHATVFFTGGGGGGGAAGTATISGGQITGVILSSGGQGYCDGIYTLQWDDTAPIGSGPYTPTTDIVLADNSFGGPFVILSPIASLSSAGTLVDGVLEGITKAYYVQYRPAAAYSYNAAIGMTFTGGSGSGPYINTAYDAGGNPTWICTPPGNVPNRANPVEPDQAIRDLCRFTNTPTPTVPATIRYMDCTLPSGAVSNARNVGDVTPLAQDSYNQPTTFLSVPIAAIRPYSHSVSPSVYVEGPCPGAVFNSGGTPTQYSIPASSDGWINTSGSTTVILVEFVSVSPHGLGTYQEFSNDIPIPSYIATTNGQIGTVQNPPIPSDIPNYPDVIYSTGASTFIAQYGAFSQTSSATMPGGINNAAFTQGVAGGINNNGVGGVAIGAPGTGYNSGAALAIAPPASAWLTALAVSSLDSSGAVAAITGVSGHAGNHYDIAPPVWIQSPSMVVAGALAACAIVGGVVQPPVLTYPGYGYTGATVPVTFWGGNPTVPATAIAVVTNGVITGFTGFTGGSGYQWPPLALIAPPSSVATATSSLSGDAVGGYSLTNPGAGYLRVVITGDGTGATGIVWTGPAAHAEASSIATSGNPAGFGSPVVGTGTITGGSGYTHATATVQGGGPYGSGAVIDCTIVGGAVVLSLGSGGSGYTPNYSGYPWVMVGAPARQSLVSATLSAGGVSVFNVVYGGRGHTVVPELVVLGNGTGASGTPVLTGDVVTSVTRNSAGSNYTGTNPIAVSVAPPARQAIATASVSGGAVQLGYVVDPGCGYTNTPPAGAVVGAGSSATATASMIFPFSVFVGVRDGGCVPYEVAAGFTASLTGCAGWYNIPPAATDALIASIMTSIATYQPTGQIWVEYSNEHWNDGFPYGAMFASLGNMTGVNKDAFYAGRTAAVHAVCEATLTSLGRGGDLVRVFGSWVISGIGGVTDAMITYANANNIRIDAVCVGPYWDIPQDSEIVLAFASIVATHPLSSAHGTTQGNDWPWTRAMAHDFLRHGILSDTRYIGSGTGGAPLGWLTSQQQALAKYNLVSGQAEPPVLVGYEASIERYAPFGMFTSDGGNALMNHVENDLAADAGMYATQDAFFLMNQAGGISVLNFFQAQDAFFGGDSWWLMRFEGQQSGRGDGSDGRATSLYWMDANTVPGAGSTAAAYTTYFDRFNPSPGLEAWRNFGAGNITFTPTPTPIPTPTLSVAPTSATVLAGATRSITATLANSSAALSAAALHGTVSTATPTSGTPFTYTAPTSGFSSDTVTVTDSDDSLTAPVAITISLTPTPTPSVRNTAFFGGRAYGTVAYNSSTLKPLPTPRPRPPVAGATIKNTAYFGGRAYGTVAYGGSSIIPLPSINPGRFHSVLSTAVLPARVSSNTAYFGGRAYGTVAYGGSSGMLPPIGAGGSFTSVLIG